MLMLEHARWRLISLSLSLAALLNALPPTLEPYCLEVFVGACVRAWERETGEGGTLMGMLMVGMLMVMHVRSCQVVKDQSHVARCTGLPKSCCRERTSKSDGGGGGGGVR